MKKYKGYEKNELDSKHDKYLYNSSFIAPELKVYLIIRSRVTELSFV